MATTSLPRVPQDADLKRTVIIINGAFDELDWLLSGAIDFKNIKAEGITAKEIKANTITADRMNVQQLSTIAADMGTITAGHITTNAEINVGTDARIGNKLYLKETDATGQKGIVFSTVTGQSGSITVLSGDMSINVSGFVTITTGSSQGLMVNGDKVASESFVKNFGWSLSYNPTTKNLSLKDYNGITISTVTLT